MARMAFVLALVFQTWTLAAAELHVTPDCERHLGAGTDRFLRLMSKVIFGQGAVTFTTVPELLTGAWLSDSVMGGLAGLLNHKSSVHTTPFGILPESVSHSKASSGMLYADLSTPALRISANERWLYVKEPGDSRRPRHAVLISHSGNDFTIWHEAIHLGDMEALHEFAGQVAPDGILAVDFRVWEFILELRAYKIPMRGYLADYGYDRERLESYAATLMTHVIATAERLPAADLRLIMNDFGLPDFEFETVVEFLGDARPVPEAIATLRHLKQTWRTSNDLVISR